MSDTTLNSPGAAFAGLSNSAAARLLALLVPVGLLGGALFSEYVGHLWPCELCWWQRYPHAAAIPLAVAAFLFPAEGGKARTLTALAALAIAVSGAIGVYHAGVEAHVFKGFSSCSTMATGASSADLLKQIMKVPLIQCDQVQWSFLGLSLAGWNAVVSFAGAASIAALLRKRRAA